MMRGLAMERCGRETNVDYDPEAIAAILGFPVSMPCSPSTSVA